MMGYPTSSPQAGASVLGPLWEAVPPGGGGVGVGGGGEGEQVEEMSQAEPIRPFPQDVIERC